MATIQEVADEAGVSVSTAARALRTDKTALRADTRERALRIRQIADRLGYRQNWAASAFRQGKTRGIGLASDHSEWLFFGMMGFLAGELSQAFAEMGYHLLVMPIDEEGKWKELASGGRVDGLVVLHHCGEALKEDIRSFKLPVVVVGDSQAEGSPRVLYDDEGGAYAATRHLIELGHRRIAMYCRDVVRPHCSVNERRRGYQLAMREAGLPDDEFRCVPEEDLLRLIVRNPDRPTAVLCYCHVEAEVLYQLLWRYGLNVPRDISIVAFNDLPSTARMTPPLTTVCFDYKRLARLAAKSLVNLVEGREQSIGDLVVHPTINLRSSTAPPRKG